MIGFLLGLAIGGIIGYLTKAAKLKGYVAMLEAELVRLEHKVRSQKATPPR